MKGLAVDAHHIALAVDVSYANAVLIGEPVPRRERDHEALAVQGMHVALHQFKDTYNRSWIVERHRYRTPAQVRADQLGLAQAA